MSSSQALQKRKTANVSQQVGQSACPTHLLQAGGPGDLQSARQQTAVNVEDKVCGRNCYYRLPIIRARTAYRSGGGMTGVDRKHGSYARYLARRVGGVLREEKMPAVVARTAIVKQPRNRTGTSSCGKLCYIPPGPVLTPREAVLKTSVKTVCSGGKNWQNNGGACCQNRIPATCSPSTTGWLGRNTQGVGSGRCSCCPKFVYPKVKN